MRASNNVASMLLDAPLIALRRGNEPIIGTTHTLSDFWRWAFSDILNNTTRGIFALLVACNPRRASRLLSSPTLTMRSLLFAVLLLASSAIAQTRITSIKEIEPGLHVMYFDTTAEKGIVTKSTIVEFADYIAMIELPITNDGNATKLIDHTEGAEAAIKALVQRFPSKPLRYVISTHWHPHSIGSVIPFITRGITVVTTRKNFEKLSQFVDTVRYAASMKNIHFVGEEGFTIEDRANSVAMYNLKRADYPAIPTEDFLFVYLPRYDCLHSSCMFQRFGSKVKGKELLTARTENVAKFLSSKKLQPKYILTTDRFQEEGSGAISGDTMRMMIASGIGMSEVLGDVLALTEDAMNSRTDSVLTYLIDSHIPATVMNSAVYDRLRAGDLGKALALARLQAMLSPSDANAWDTYAEAHYFLGNITLAKRYSAESKRIDKSAPGGEESWKQDLELFRKNWK